LDIHRRQKRYLSTPSEIRRQHLDSSIFQFKSHGRNFMLHLLKNDILIHPNFEAVTYGINGWETINFEHCYYHGYLANRNTSKVSAHTCSGLKGYIQDEDGEEFLIEPLFDMDTSSNNSLRHIIYNVKDHKTRNGNHTCGNYDKTFTKNTLHYDEVHLSSRYNANRLYRNIMPSYNQRKKRAAEKPSEAMKYSLTTVVCDKAMKQRRCNGDAGKCVKRALSIMNHVDMVFKSLNVRTPVRKIIVSGNSDVGFTAHSNSKKTLDSLCKYAERELHLKQKLGHDNTVLITGVDLVGSVVGLARVGSMCSLQSGCINEDHEKNELLTANTVAHEIGHNIGLGHIKDNCACPKSPCVMTASVPHTPVQSFSSDCSLGSLNAKLDKGNMPCLLDKPSEDEMEGPIKCGDQYLQKGEECDCGTKEECEASGASRCCDPTTCRLKASSVCAFGACCNTETCNYHNVGKLCRDKISSCDLPEFCSGKSSECGPNFFVEDGIKCENGQEGYCFAGSCVTHTSQCKGLWGKDAVVAHNACWKINDRGTMYGHCGKLDEEMDPYKAKFKKCKKKDFQCGSLQCCASPKCLSSDTPRFPIIGSNKRSQDTWLGSVYCRIGYTFLGADMEDPTIAASGTKCGEGMICYNNECTNISTIQESYNINFTKCRKECQNGGTCNNNGHCHCPPGFGCPYCKVSGPGGSVDSGQGCIKDTTDCGGKNGTDSSSGCLSTTVKVLLIFFLLVCPFIGLVAWLIFRQRVTILSKFSWQGRTKEVGGASTENARVCGVVNQGATVRFEGPVKTMKSEQKSKSKSKAGKGKKTGTKKNTAPEPPDIANSKEQPPPSYHSVVSYKSAPGKNPPPSNSNTVPEKALSPLPPSTNSKRHAHIPPPPPGSRLATKR